MSIDKLIEGTQSSADNHRIAFAKELAIGFSEWIAESTYRMATHDINQKNVGKWYNVCGVDKGQQLHFTTFELLQLYLQSNNQ